MIFFKSDYEIIIKYAKTCNFSHFAKTTLKNLNLHRLVKNFSEKCDLFKILHLSLHQKLLNNSNMTATALNYKSSEINRDFRIKVSGRDNEGKRIHKLVGVSGLLNLIGAELMNKFIARSYACMEDSCTCKLRRGLKVTFYCK